VPYKDGSGKTFLRIYKDGTIKTKEGRVLKRRRQKDGNGKYFIFVKIKHKGVEYNFEYDRVIYKATHPEWDYKSKERVLHKDDNLFNSRPSNLYLAPPYKKPKKYTVETKKLMRYLYRYTELSLREIGEMHGCTKQLVWKFVHEVEDEIGKDKLNPENYHEKFKTQLKFDKVTGKFISRNS